MDMNRQRVIDRARAVAASWEQYKANSNAKQDISIHWFEKDMAGLIASLDEMDKGTQNDKT